MCCCCCCSSCCDFFLVLIALVFPPIPVIWKRGCCSVDLLINLLLCTLGLVPGIIHAWFVILDSNSERVFDEEAQRVVLLVPANQQLLITKQPQQTHITFQHPQPFRESAQHAHLNVVETRMSPLTRDYGSLSQDVPPPPYDNVIDSTFKS